MRIKNISSIRRDVVTEHREHLYDLIESVNEKITDVVRKGKTEAVFIIETNTILKPDNDVVELIRLKGLDEVVESFKEAGYDVAVNERVAADEYMDDGEQRHKTIIIKWK